MHMLIQHVDKTLNTANNSAVLKLVKSTVIIRPTVHQPMKSKKKQYRPN